MIRQMIWLGAAALCAAMTATSAMADAARPFPFHTTYTQGVIKPTNVTQAKMDETLLSYYDAWKTNYLRDAGGEYWVKYDNTNSTVSEAHGYGMVLTAYMADKAIFDSMFRYFKAHPSHVSPHLMAWKQTLKNGQMVNVEGADSATDGDLDVAYALLLADVQWGSAGAINYKAQSRLILRDVLAQEVNTSTKTLTPGDWASGKDALHTRPSDFMTGHMLAFAKADTAHAAKWNAIHDKIATIVNYQFAHGSRQTGLMPDFMVKSGARFVPVPGKYLETKHDGDFSYNACRTPWRLAISYIVNGRTDMLPALRKQASWIRQTTSGDPSRIKAGYYVLNGPNGQNFVNYSDLPFTAPFVVNAMTGGKAGQAWLNALWTSITGGDFNKKTDYYGDTIRLQVMLTVAGDWWAP
jgi:endo-1,4-beta-D-glucanase Y